MTTAETHRASAGELAEDRIRATVRALMGAYRIKTVDLGRIIGASRATAYNKLDGRTSFSAGEVAELADYFGCSVQDIYAGTVTIAASGPNGERPVNTVVNHRYRPATTGAITTRPTSRPKNRHDSTRPGPRARDHRARLDHATTPATQGDRSGRDLRPNRSADGVAYTGGSVTERHQGSTCLAA